ncbi:MAG: AbrB family transcriptional regulator [Pseudomonadota bacterium]
MADRAPAKGAPSREPLTLASALRMGIAMVLGALGALGFYIADLPLPWFLGALTLTLVLSVAGFTITPPRPLGKTVRAILGVAIGTAFTPALLDRLAPMALSLLILVPYVIAIMACGMFYFRRFAGYDRPTAFFAAVPGGLTDMILMAQDVGAHVRTVTLIQATRIVMIVFLLPFWLQWHDGFEIAGRAGSSLHLVDLPAIDGVVMIAMGVFGAWAAGRLGLAGAAIVGPMIVSGVAHAAGLTTAQMPVEVLVFAQITLGVLLGVRFRGLTWQEFRATMAWGLAFSVALLGLTLALVSVLAPLTGFDAVSLLLGYAPGGQGELNLVAYIVGADVAFVALHHLVRVALVLFAAQVVIGLRFKRNLDDG